MGKDTQKASGPDAAGTEFGLQLPKELEGAADMIVSLVEGRSQKELSAVSAALLTCACTVVPSDRRRDFIEEFIDFWHNAVANMFGNDWSLSLFTVEDMAVAMVAPLLAPDGLE